MNLLPAVRGPEVARVAQQLAGGGGIVTVAADTAEEAVAVRKLAVAQLDDSWAMAAVDITRCVSTRDLAVQLARAVCSMVISDATALDLPDEQLTVDQRAELVRLANTAGARLLRGARGDVGEHDDVRDHQELIGDALDTITRRAASNGRTLLALDGADELLELPRKSRARFTGAADLLWLIRGRVQHAVVTPTIVFAGGPATTDLVSDRAGGMFGWGTEVTVERAPAQILHTAVMAQLETQRPVGTAAFRDEVARAVIDRAERSLPTIERLLPVLPRDRGGSASAAVLRAWTTLLEMNADVLRQAARALSALDRLALAVARAIAERRPPYTIAEAPHGSEVAKALASLRIAGFATSPQKGDWRLTDPLFAAWLRGRASRGRAAVEVQDLRRIG
ncbi:MAG TPA: hypothetical protein VJT75_09100 [Thermoleophilaceae bacterium]|nr:hypothetical protein [Thermoleophilaceae bacterium]